MVAATLRSQGHLKAKGTQGTDTIFLEIDEKQSIGEGGGGKSGKPTVQQGGRRVSGAHNLGRDDLGRGGETYIYCKVEASARNNSGCPRGEDPDAGKGSGGRDWVTVRSVDRKEVGRRFACFGKRGHEGNFKLTPWKLGGFVGSIKEN